MKLKNGKTSDEILLRFIFDPAAFKPNKKIDFNYFRTKGYNRKQFYGFINDMINHKVLIRIKPGLYTYSDGFKLLLDDDFIKNVKKRYEALK